MTETSGPVLRRWLLTAVLDTGEAPRPEVHARVQERFGADFTVSDLASRRGHGDEPVWRNNLDSLYDKLKKSGVMQQRPRGSDWALTTLGMREATAFPPAPRPAILHPPVNESDLLAEFKPKDSSEYISRISGQVLLKQRTHEVLLRNYGEAMARAGWRPRTNVHPRDLQLDKGAAVWVVEVKIVYKGDSTQAVRAALAQLLEYRHFFYGDDERVGMLAVFSESIGQAYEYFLELQMVAAVWPAGHAWTGSALARRHRLIPLGLPLDR